MKHNGTYGQPGVGRESYEDRHFQLPKWEYVEQLREGYGILMHLCLAVSLGSLVCTGVNRKDKEMIPSKEQ